GNVRDNILYGNDEYLSFTNEQILDVLKNMGLLNLLSKFEKGLDTKVSTSGESISLGQKQLIAFIRAILKKPEVLILDEATANIDTVTEQLLDNMLNNLSKNTIKVIIAHRLNTIKNADEIFFVNSGTITCTGSMDEALELLMNGKRNS
ncbi:MAG: ATP-binding cassette domain-containing protein, partial [Candidatus Gracilibacteria bacterium]|nr:ATP-binding cassette domain-containing protein [Candidatus Gracilibacteria bacterium]